MNTPPLILTWTDRAGGDAEDYRVPVIDQLNDDVDPCNDSFATSESEGSDSASSSESV